LQKDDNTDEFVAQIEKRISQSLTYDSWKRYETALHSFQKFLESENDTLQWPISKTQVIKYVT
jgi:hypothetical protein